MSQNLLDAAFQYSSDLYALAQPFIADTVGMQLEIYFPLSEPSIYGHVSNDTVYRGSPDVIGRFPCFGLFDERMAADQTLDNQTQSAPAGFYASVSLRIPDDSKVIVRRGSREMQYKVYLDMVFEGNVAQVTRRYILVPMEDKLVSTFSNLWSLLLNGGSWVAVPNSTEFEMLSMTVAVWFKTNLPGALISKFENGVSDKEWFLSVASTGELRAAVYEDPSTLLYKDYQTVEKVNDAQYYLGGFAYGPDVLILALNGIEQVVTVNHVDALGPLVAGNSGILIGSISAGAGPSLLGSIDEVSIWKRKFSPEEWAELYAGGTPRDAHLHSAVADLVAYWRFEQTLTDSADHHDGTPGGVPGPAYSSDVPPTVRVCP